MAGIDVDPAEICFSDESSQQPACSCAVTSKQVSSPCSSFRCTSFSAVSIESLAALESALLALGHSRGDAESPQLRVEYVVAQKRLRDGRFEAASAQGNAVDYLRVDDRGQPRV